MSSDNSVSSNLANSTLVSVETKNPQTSNVLSLAKTRLIKGSVWAFGSQIGGSLAGMFSNLLLARLLSPEELGTYFIALSIALFAAQFSLFGLPTAIVRLVAESIGSDHAGRAQEAIRLCFKYAIFGIMLVVTLLYLGGDWLAVKLFESPSLKQSTHLLAILVIPLALRILVTETFRGFHDIRLASIFGGVSFSALGAVFYLLVWLLFKNASITQILSLSIVSATIPVLVGGGVLRRRLRKLAPPTNLNNRLILDMMFSLSVMSIATFALKQAGIWVSGVFLPEDQVALYGAAMRLVIMMAMPLSLVDAVIPPIIAELSGQNKPKEMERILRAASTYGGVPSAIVLIGFVLFGAPIMGLVYGDFFRKGAEILSILSVGQLVNVWTGSCYFTLMMTGNHRTITAIYIIFGLINVTASILLVQHYGISGIAIAFSVSVTIQNVIAVLYAKKRVGIWTHFSFSLLFSRSQTKKLYRDLVGLLKQKSDT